MFWSMGRLGGSQLLFCPSTFRRTRCRIRLTAGQTQLSKYVAAGGLTGGAAGREPHFSSSSADSVYHTFMKGCNVFDRGTLLSTYSTTFCYCSPDVQLQFGLQNVALIHQLT